MKAHYSVLFTGIAFCLASLPAWPQSVASRQPKPVTVRYAPDHNQAFWITNSTDKTLAISLSKIEVQVGSEWKAYSEPIPNPGLVYFLHTQAKLGWLAPHEMGYGTLLAPQSISLPTNSVWRAQFSVSEQLKGRERDEAAKQLRKVQKNNPKLHSSAASASDNKYYGHPQIVYSDEVRP
jgi:hypothetical protein